MTSPPKKNGDARQSAAETESSSADIEPRFRSGDKKLFKINPAFAKLIPPLAVDELAGLEANLLKNGCLDPLKVWNGVLIDGHNRFAICQKHDLPFKIVNLKLENEEAAKDFIDAIQLDRRNLTPDQRSIIRGRRYNRQKIQSGTRTDLVAKCDKVDTASAIAKATGVSRATIIRDGKRADALDALAKSHPDQAQAVLDGKKRFNEVRRELKKEGVRKAGNLPNAKFRVFYADPPWSYSDKCDAGSVQGGGAENHYPSMGIAELCAMPVANLAEPDAVLFLWVTSPMLEECFQVIAAWGFSYKASFVWDKVKHNMGHYVSVRHEFLLICTRGSCTPDVAKLFDSVQTIERTKHSAKPKEFREIIDTLYPHGKRLELFARKETPGWQVFGNQIGGRP